MQIPPLNGLRAFEAAARHLSFTRAAEELNVTQSAISHQIRTLEDRLGIRLFRRLNQALVLTDAGQLLLPSVRDAFARLATGLERVMEHERSGVLTMSVSPSFASRWLMSRIGRFRARHPEIHLRISVSQHEIDFEREADIDIGLRHGLGVWEGLRADRFLDDAVFPVCSPALLQGPTPLGQPADLRHHVLVEETGHSYWATWLAMAGLGDLKPSSEMVFDEIGIAIEAAENGQGIAMARGTLVLEELASGRLTRLFDLALPGDFGYYLVCPEVTADRPKIAAFRRWIMEEGAADRLTVTPP
ncbi:transcriptional regulator GcvA [Azospirillum brasilense]|uniref:transcriptional regulator GcvA n=1 Tax=Azospirillum brasilense TaxID=192 RepID=UPI00190D1B60|nr:transcriptional regulator GcvA [Azospirillum brasilense]MBK3735925.1 transcriptional regulator GcvA [Azospirillum brasilense]